MVLYVLHLQTKCSSLSTSTLHSLQILPSLGICAARPVSISSRCDETLSWPMATWVLCGKKASRHSDGYFRAG